eukprot:s2692_g5.t1
MFGSAGSQASAKQSLEEFQAQRDAMACLGMDVRKRWQPGKREDRCESKEAPQNALPRAQRKFLIGTYTVIEDQLGSGSYGKVFSSCCPNGRSCAIKVYRSRHAHHEAASELAVYKELAKLGMPHCQSFPVVLDFDTSGRPWPWLLGWAAICVLHNEARIFHLDIKPENILWCAELKELRLCDFGMSEPAPTPRSMVCGPCSRIHGPCSRIFGAARSTGSGCRPKPYNPATLLRIRDAFYRPPELWNLVSGPAVLQAALTKAVDLWSFGCVVFEVVTGKPLMTPFDRRQPSCKQCVAEWCKAWPELIASSTCVARTAGSWSRWHARMRSCGRWSSVVLDACCPQPKSRKWMKDGAAHFKCTD